MECVTEFKNLGSIVEAKGGSIAIYIVLLLWFAGDDLVK